MNLLNHKAGRGLVAFALYFAEGAPIGFIWWAMPTILRQNKVDLAINGAFTAMLVLPWGFKFLWAPLVDVLRTSRFGFTKWIIVSQVFMCLCLVPLIFIPLKENLMWWAALLFLHSIAAATQDVAVDAMVINVASGEERGRLNGYMQAGMLLGRSVFGGGTLILIPKIGLSLTMIFMILTIASILFLFVFIKEPEIKRIDKEHLKHFREKLRRVFGAKQTWYVIGFALTAAAAFEATGAMAGSFLTDRQVSMEAIGFFIGVPVIISMLLGGILGGFLSDYGSRKKVVAFSFLAIVASVMLIAVLAFININLHHHAWMLLFSIMYFFTGMFTASSYALFMDATDPELGATQFSTYMSATNGCEVWAVWSAGIFAASYSYGTAFLIMSVVSIISLVFLVRIKENQNG